MSTHVLAAETALAAAQEALAVATKTCELRLREVEDAKQALDCRCPFVHRHLSTAYALWAFTPLLWPGSYLFYLGRDTECWLMTVTFGGFGIGWLVDGLCIPAYVADCNEPVGHLDRSWRRYRSYLSLPAMLAPIRLIFQFVIGIIFGVVAANLLPPRWVSPLGVERGAVFRFCVGSIAAALGVRLSCTQMGRTRTWCGWRSVAGWTAVLASLTLGSDSNFKSLVSEGVVPQLVIACVGACIGQFWDKSFAPECRPQRNLAKGRYQRLLRQLVTVGLATSAATGAFYLNGSITLMDEDSGKPSTYSGAEALSIFYGKTMELGSNIREAVWLLHEQNKHKSFFEMWTRLKAVFADPAREAAEVLDVPFDASEALVKKAYRELARKHHPDKQQAMDDTSLANAEHEMQRLNWAKEILISKKAGA